MSNDGTVVGLDVGANTLEHVSNEIRQHTDLPLQPSLDLIKTSDGRSVLAPSVDPSPQTVFTSPSDLELGYGWGPTTSR